MVKDVMEGLINAAIGYTATLVITLQDINVMIGILVGMVTTFYLVVKIIKVFREMKRNDKSS